MQTQMEIPSKYGPVTVELLRCDECDSAVQVKYAVGWCQLANIGIDISTLSSLPALLHFCSHNCLKAYLGEH